MYAIPKKDDQERALRGYSQQVKVPNTWALCHQVSFFASGLLQHKKILDYIGLALLFFHSYQPEGIDGA